MNPLTALPPAVRLWIYIIAGLVLLVIGIWQAADGDWLKFIGLLAAALVNGTAASNVAAKVDPAPDAHPFHDPDAGGLS